MIQLQMLANDLLDFTTLLDQEHQGMVLVLQSLSLIQTKPTLFQGILYRVTALENLCSGYVYLPSTSGTLALETLKVKIKLLESWYRRESSADRGLYFQFQGGCVVVG